MRAVDTNVLVRLVARDDPRQALTAERFVEHGAWVSQLALAEASWVLSSVYELTSQEIGRVVEMLLEHKQLVIQDPDTVAAALALFRQRPALGFWDCLKVELARKAGHLPLGTFDRKLGKVEGAERL